MNKIIIRNIKEDFETTILLNEICTFISDEFHDDEVRIDKEEISKQGTKGIITLVSVISILQGVALNILAAVIYDIVKESVKRAYIKSKQTSVSCVRGAHGIDIYESGIVIITIEWDDGVQ